MSFCGRNRPGKIKTGTAGTAPVEKTRNAKKTKIIFLTKNNQIYENYSAIEWGKSIPI